MKWRSKYQSDMGRVYEIELDEIVGYYFYASGNGIEPYDGLQDTFKFAVEEAEEEYGVPVDSWVQIE